VTNAAATADCGLALPSLGSSPANLSCYIQVSIAPYVDVAERNLRFYECVDEAEDPRPARFESEMIAAIIVIGLIFLLPNAWLALVWLSRPRAESGGAPAPAGPAAEGFSLAEASTASAASFESSDEPAERVKRVYLSFSDIHYSVKLNASARARAKAALPKGKGKRPLHWDQKHVLRGVSGVFAPGSLSAIMGPSGCGKSTLLDVLADRKNGGEIAGEVLLNGKRRDAYFKRVSAYVMQFDALFETLTVREMLAYTAELRLTGGGETSGVREAAVERVIRDLDLTKVADTRIGGATRRGISGGQARRVTVGVELVTSPSVLFLDEPTTGLDAYSSLLLVRALRRLADSGRTILCTIHQPRADIFALFDTLLLMAAGKAAYFGPTASIGTYLGSLGIRLPSGTNPADFVVDLTYAKEPGPQAASAPSRPGRFSKRFSLSGTSKRLSTSEVDATVAEQSWRRERSASLSERLVLEALSRRMSSVSPRARISPIVSASNSPAPAAFAAPPDSPPEPPRLEDAPRRSSSDMSPHLAVIMSGAKSPRRSSASEKRSSALLSPALLAPTLAEGLSAGSSTSSAGGSTVDSLVDSWANSDANAALVRTCEQLAQRTLPGLPPPVDEVFAEVSRATGAGRSRRTRMLEGLLASKTKARSIPAQIAILTRRAYLKGVRDRDFWYRMLFIPLLQFAFYAILFVWTRSSGGGMAPYDGWTPEDDEYITVLHLISAKRSFLYQTLTAAVITETAVLAECYTEQRAFRREHAAGGYSAAAYHLQWAFRLMAQALWKAVLFGSVVYWAPYQFAPTAEAFFYFIAVFALLSSTGSAFSLLMISFIPDPEGAGTAHNAIVSVLLQFSGFYLPACLMPPVVNIPYIISFGKFAFEGLLQNEFGDQPYGSRWSYFGYQSMDPVLSKWTNLLALGLYPFVFHALAFVFTFLHTRPRSFWTRFDSEAKRAERIARARLEPPPGSSAPPAQQL